ncbi:MAG TPA: NAD(P)-binding protein [Gemmatimonas sp.]|uniref:NAD(P)-binding protein n=1 Tax=Gemmatimonas sp. TaxID=1962908 RepID=UPI002EDA3089
MTPSRRDLLKSLGAMAFAPAFAPALVGLSRKGHVIGGGFIADGSATGHAVRDGSLRQGARGARRELRTSVAIVGGGMGGLSAAWQLDALGMTDWLLLEMDTHTGGNARSARPDGVPLADAARIRAPWGAHYVPVPDADAVHVRRLFRELGVLSATGEWDERTLCHTPQERLWQHGRWHEGLEPMDAISAADRAQFARFDARIDELRATRMFRVPGAMGHEARRRALAAGGAAARTARGVEELDTLTADAWMRREGFTAPALRWWVEYGTRDDFGASLQQASAWAAVHYFAARDSEEHGPLTWPEGNDFIAQALTKRLMARASRDGGPRIHTGAVAWQIAREGKRWVVDTPQARIMADAVIWAAPMFVLPRVFPTIELPNVLEYAPWVVANVVLHRMPDERGAPLAWDNVIYGSPSLGYVNAGHQLLGRPTLPVVWTWYHAVVDRPAAEGRQWLQQRPWTEWRDQIVQDLTRAHPDIADCITRVDIMRWGHAMARPKPGLLHRLLRLRDWQTPPGMFLAHADLSGMSLFEEAQWHGVAAATRAFALVGKGGSGRAPATRDDEEEGR